jgi:hypothetical protein
MSGELIFQSQRIRFSPEACDDGAILRVPANRWWVVDGSNKDRQSAFPLAFLNGVPMCFATHADALRHVRRFQKDDAIPPSVRDNLGVEFVEIAFIDQRYERR